MVKRLNGDLLLFFKDKKSYVHQHLLYRFLFRRKEKENKSAYTRSVCSKHSIKVLGCFKTQKKENEKKNS